MTDGVPPRWLVLSVPAIPGEPGALMGEALLALGGRAVWEDGDRLVTHLAGPDSGDDAPAFARERVEALRQATGEPGLDVEVRWQEHEDWAEVWKRGLEPRRVGSRFLVTPSWCDPHPRRGDLVVVVDPGMAFGNAEHGTTRGCLRLLEVAVRQGDAVLDVGAGSGILSIAAALLGAADVLALEGDAWAVAPARENVWANGVADRVDVQETEATADRLMDLEPRDGVVANIETGILRGLAPGLAAAVAPGGWLLLSGITEDEWPDFREEVESLGPSLRQVDADGEWRSALFDRA